MSELLPLVPHGRSMILARRACLMVAFSVLLAGCDRDFAVDTWVSDEFPGCAADDTACDVALQRADSVLLAELAAGTSINARELERLTGVRWRKRTERGVVNSLRLGGVNPLEEPRAARVLEMVRAGTARDTAMSIASNGGAAVWLNGALLGKSRSPNRPARAHQDLYAVSLRAGDNLLLYRVVTGSVDAQLHRTWLDSATIGDALAASIEIGAYVDLPRDAMLADTSTVLPLDLPQVRLTARPQIAFRWKTLLGEPLSGGGDHAGMYPEALEVPASFPGMGVLEVSVSDGGRRIYHEEVPIFRDSTATRLVRTLVTDSAITDPVRSARNDAVRTFFGMAGDSIGRFSSWHRAHALADLYRHVAEPERFHRHPGPQIWGWRDAAGVVQPYWLTVPPSVADGTEAAESGLVFSLVHFVDSVYWRGRGGSAGWVGHMATLSARNGTFSVVPHLGGGHDFGESGVPELAGIVHQVDSVFPLDTGAVAILAWSAHARETVELAQHRELPLARVGLAVAALHRDAAELDSALAAVHAVRPDLRWTFWRAAEDDRIPRERSEGWAEAVRRAGFEVEYHEVPFSTHLGGFFHDVEAALHRQVAPQAGR